MDRKAGKGRSTQKSPSHLVSLIPQGVGSAPPGVRMPWHSSFLDRGRCSQVRAYPFAGAADGRRCGQLPKWRRSLVFHILACRYADNYFFSKLKPQNPVLSPLLLALRPSCHQWLPLRGSSAEGAAMSVRGHYHIYSHWRRVALCCL